MDQNLQTFALQINGQSSFCTHSKHAKRGIFMAQQVAIDNNI
jgi:hypothetical protein